jgi:hypothetical protein
LGIPVAGDAVVQQLGWPPQSGGDIVRRGPLARRPGLERIANGANMKKLLGLSLVLGLAIVLILTKPAQRDMAFAANRQMNYIVINREKLPPDFATAAVAAAAEDLFTIGVRGVDESMQWRTTDLAFLLYSDFAVARVGSLKCVWLLRNGFCAYFPR